MTTRSVPSITLPSVTYFGVAVLSAVDDEHELAALIGADRLVGHQQRLIGRRARHLDPREHAWREQRLGIGKLRPATDRAGRAVDHVVDEVHLPFVGEFLLVDQLERDRGAGIRVGHQLGGALVAQERRLVEGEFEADRIDRYDGGEQRRHAGDAAGDEIARRDAPVADPAGDRRAQFGELQVELGLLDRRLLRRDLGLRGAVRLRALIEQLLGDGALAHQRLRALQIGFGEGEISLRLRQIGARLIQRVLERPAVDGEQQVALLDDLAVLEMDLVEVAGHARADFDRLHRDEAPDILVLIDDGALDGLRHRDGRRRRRGLLLWGLAASRQREHQEYGGEPRGIGDGHKLRC